MVGDFDERSDKSSDTLEAVASSLGSFMETLKSTVAVVAVIALR